jgi:hypothetical protein
LNKLRLRRDGIDWREVDGEIIALEATTSTYLATNRTATTLWRALAEGAERDQLVEQLVSEFHVDRETAAADVDAFIDELASRGLLER